MYGLMLCLTNFTICAALKIFVLRENEKREHEPKKGSESGGFLPAVIHSASLNC